MTGRNLNTGRNLGKAVKVDDATYDKLRRLADKEDRTISAVLRRAVSAYSGKAA